MKPEIRLISGRLFNFVEPDPLAMTIEVIAAALSKQCRFAGHTERFYSVAEHCVRGSYLCEEPLAFLLHDASEAFCVDVPTPLKRMLTGYAEVEDRIQDVLGEKYGVYLRSDAVKHTDRVMLAWEQRDLVPSAEHEDFNLPTDGLAGQSGRPETWERRYVERFLELTK